MFDEKFSLSFRKSICRNEQISKKIIIGSSPDFSCLFSFLMTSFRLPPGIKELIEDIFYLFKRSTRTKGT